jgi:transposase
MGSIIKKSVKKYTYYYYVESKRINGKPKLVNQKYLGTAEKVLEKVLVAEKELSERVLYSDEADFGAVTLIYDIAKRLGISDIIDSHIPKRKQGASIGAYILTAAINRAVSPSSKNGIQEWYADTCLPYITGLKPSLFTPQNFWNNTCISEDDINRIEESILRKVIDTYQIDTSHIIYDATNFFTYIDTMQESELSKRGWCKKKRYDLRIVGLSLMVSPEYSVPLLHEAYPGNRSDAKEFPIMMERLKSRYEAITGKEADVTVVFDRGNNSEDNIELLESGDFKLHYIGGLKKNQCKELYLVSRDDYTPLESAALEGQTAYRSEMYAFGRTVTVVIVHNPELERGQMQGILINKEKAETRLFELQQQLMRRASRETTKGRKPTKESVTKAVEKILGTEYMRDVFNYIVLENDGNIYLSFEYSEEELERIRIDHLGKSVLFTNRKDFSNEQIVTAYRSAWQIESAFKQMNDPDCLAVRPMFHWTDEKIRVHIFTCVLAYRLCSLLIKELSDYGISISINRLIKEMSRIKRIHTFFDDIDKPTKVQSFTLGSAPAARIEQLYSLKEKYN